jgi:hypothetical protein
MCRSAVHALAVDPGPWNHCISVIVQLHPLRLQLQLQIFLNAAVQMLVEGFVDNPAG